jgi:DNA-binding PadR family transcriptional regulator
MHAEMAFPQHRFHGTGDWWPRQRWMAMTGSRRHGRQGRRHMGPGFGSWFGHGGFQDPFFGRGPKVGRGDVRTAILVLLSEGPMHGYQVIQELTERSHGVWRPSAGSIDPTLQQLQDEGLVRSEEIDGRRVFDLTEAGRAEVEKRGENASLPWEMREGVGPLTDLRDEGISVFAALMQVANTGTEGQIARAKEILTEARKSLFRLLAEDDPEPGGESSPI